MNKDPSMTRVLAAWRLMTADKKWNLQKLGVAMGFPEKSARQSAEQFLRAKNPFVSSLRRFAKAAGMRMEELCE